MTDRVQVTRIFLVAFLTLQPYVIHVIRYSHGSRDIIS